MLLSPAIAVLLFLALLGLGLGLYLLGSTGLLLVRRRGAEETGSFEDRSLLALLVGVVLVWLRLLAWPLFYVALKASVGSFEGAMCLYGVLQAEPRLGTLVQLLKLALVFLGGAYLVVHRIDARSRSAPLRAVRVRLLLALSLFAIAEAGAEAAFWLRLRPTISVTCCTTVADVGERPTALLPRALLGEGAARLVGPGWLGLAAGLLVLLGLGVRRRWAERASWAASLAVAGVLFLGLSWVAAVESLAPAWTAIPAHHCFYCLLLRPDAAVAVLAAVLAAAALAGGGTAHLVARVRELGEEARAEARRLHGIGFWLLAVAVGLAGLRLWLAR